MTTKTPARKWRLTAYPKGQPRFARENGRSKSTALWAREYLVDAVPYRAVSQVHRMFPDAVLVLMPFTFKGWYWGGDSRDDITLYWCPGCDGRLDWAADQWICLRCGDEWHDEQIRPAEKTSNEETAQ